MIRRLFKRDPIENIYFKLSIKNRLILYFTLSIFIPMIIVTTTVYHKSKSIIENKIELTIEKSMDTIADVVLKKIESVYDISTLVTYNKKILDILSGVKDISAIAIVNEMIDLESIIDGYYLFGRTYTDGSDLYPNLYMLNRPEYNQYNITNKIFDINKISDTPWYKNLSKEAFSIAGVDEISTLNGKVDTIKIARRLYRTNDPVNPFAALLTIDMETAYFNTLLNQLKLSDSSITYIIDDKNQFIAGHENNLLMNVNGENNRSNNDENSYFSYTEKIEGIEMLVSIKHINKLNWNIVAITPMDELNQELISFSKVIFWVIMICVFFSVIAALLLADDISKPIKQLVKSMATVKHDNFDIDLVYKRSDEFGFLIKQYKAMMAQIKQLIDKLYISELKKNRAELKAKDAEMEALLAQINPHFLYNTLDSINWLAIKYKVEDISIMVKSLSNFFRYSLNGGKSIINFSDERNQVESYLKMQHARFKEMLDYYIEFQPEINNCYTIKLILQPLVENAIIHGIQKKNEPGFISIIGKVVEDHIEIKISDNGLGADVDVINRMLNFPEKDNLHVKSIGIKNVNNRIKNFFGEDYGISYSRNKEGGITVLLKLKIIRQLEVTHAENDNC